MPSNLFTILFSFISNVFSKYLNSCVPSKYIYICGATNPGTSRLSSSSDISVVSRNYNVDTSIIFGNIEVLQGSLIGELIVIIKGADENIKNAVDYLNNKNIEVEVIKDASISC